MVQTAINTPLKNLIRIKIPPFLKSQKTLHGNSLQMSEKCYNVITKNHMDVRRMSKGIVYPKPLQRYGRIAP
jgi:hypothetical protein